MALAGGLAAGWKAARIITNGVRLPCEPRGPDAPSAQLRCSLRALAPRGLCAAGPHHTDRGNRPRIAALRPRGARTRRALAARDGALRSSRSAPRAAELHGTRPHVGP